MKRLQLYTSFILLFSFGNAIATDGAGQYGFVENKGQVTDQNDKPNSAVVYLLNTQGMNVQLRHGGFSYDTYVATETGHREMPGGGKIRELQYTFQRIDVTLAGSNKHCEMIAEQAGGDHINYYTNGVQLTNIHHYGKVTYKNIYNGIDLEFVINPASGKTVEYNFIVAPGADASAIRLQYDGAENTALADNKIKLKLQNGELEEKIPASYIACNRQAVAVTYAQYGANTYGFNIPAYDRRETLVIDPTPDRSWGTYYGGSGQDQFRAMTISGGNLLYATGLAGSTTKIATTGAHKTTLSGTYDAVLAQFSTGGVRNWATYYGGTNDDDGRAIAGNAAGDVYIGGETRSASGFNVTGAHQSTYGGATTDGFIAKFNNTGALQWSSYYGGGNVDIIWSIATNQAGDVYFAGQTSSPGNIATALTEQPAHGGGRDGFLVKFSSAGVRQWGTYVGGALEEEAMGVATDPSGNVYLAGNALVVPANIATPGSHQPVYGGNSDQFLIKYTAAGTRQWGTYYGGTGKEDGWANVETDLLGNVYLSGTTESAGAIATPGASQVTKSPALSDGYVAKFNTNGVRQWGTYFGAAGGNTGMKCMWVDGGHVYLAGYTQAPGLATTNAYQTTLGPNSTTVTDAVVIKMDDANSAVVWATYYGGDDLDQPSGICNDADGRVYVGGVTESTTGFSSVGSHQSIHGGGQDGFMVRFHECGTVTGTAVAVNVCPGVSNGSLTVTPSGGVAPYQYKLINGTYQSSPTISGLTPASYDIIIKDDNGCEGTINGFVGQNPPVYKPALAGTLPVERDDTVTYITTAQPGITFNWVVTGGGTIISGQGTTSIDVRWNTIGNGEVKVIATGIAPCTDSTIMPVKIDAPVSVKDITGSTLALYPNPNSGSFVLKGETGANKEMQVQVFNAIGHVVYTEAITANNGMVEKQYNLSHLASGIYTVVLKSDAGRQNIRLVITR